MPVDVLVPPLGTNVDVLTLISWYKQEGETVAKDEPLFVVETDKATLDVEAPASGILGRILAEPGAEVAALSVIATILVVDDVDAVAFVDSTAGAKGAGRSAGAPANPAPSRTQLFGGGLGASIPLSVPTIPEPAAPFTQGTAGYVGRLFISPRARRLAEARGLEWRALIGTGPEGAIIERDIVARLGDLRRRAATPLAQRAAQSAEIDWRGLAGTGSGGRVVHADVARAAAERKEHGGEADPAGFSNRPDPTDATDPPKDSQLAALANADSRELLETTPLAGARAVIAARMAQAARTTAPVTLTAHADATDLVAERSRLASEGRKYSYNAFLFKIVAQALTEHPRLNASLVENEIRVWRSVHIGLAVDSEHGLRVPVIRDVDRKSLEELEQEALDLVNAAREGQSLQVALRGGTFTITNLGMYGIAAFTPVINLPECAILGVGQIRAEPAVYEGAIVVRQKMWLSLTFDHRLVDGAPAARFLQRVVQLIENPALLTS